MLDALVGTSEWLEHMTRAALHLEGSGTVCGVTGDGVKDRMELWTRSIPTRADDGAEEAAHVDLVGTAEVVSAVAVLVGFGFAVAITRLIDLPAGQSRAERETASAPTHLDHRNWQGH
jgi:hypothetical protein